LTTQRLQYAHELLETTDLSTKQITRKCSFVSEASCRYASLRKFKIYLKDWRHQYNVNSRSGHRYRNPEPRRQKFSQLGASSFGNRLGFRGSTQFLRWDALLADATAINPKLRTGGMVEKSLFNLK